jgi:hypothetical protein
VALLTCLVVRLLMAWRPDVLDRIPSEGKEPAVLGGEMRLKQNPKPPQVLLVGSSLTLAGFVPDQLADHLRLSAGDVGQFSLGAGTPWDALVLFRRNTTLLDEVRLVVLDISPWQMGEAVWDVIYNRFLWNATLSERWQAPGRRKFEAVGDWLWPCLTERREMRMWLLGLQGLARPHSEPTTAADADERNPYWRAYADPQQREQAMTRSKFSPEVAAEGMAQFRWSADMERAVHALLALLSEHHVPVLLHQQPLHPRFFASVEQHAEARDNYSAYSSFVRSLAGPDVHVQIWETPEEAGIRAEQFLDYGHLGRPGAEAYTRTIARLIDDEHLLAERRDSRSRAQARSRDPQPGSSLED